MKRRLLSAFLAVMMVLTMAPVAFAADETNTTSVGSYEDLVKAVANASDGDTIKLANDITLANTLTIDKNITLDGQENTISGTVSSGSFISVQIPNDGDFTMTNCVIVPSGKVNPNAAINLSVNGKVSVTNCTFGAKSDTAGYMYNGLEFSQTYAMGDTNITGNTFYGGAFRHNCISFYKMAENANINISNNDFVDLNWDTTNAIRVSNYSSANATITLKGNDYSTHGSEAGKDYAGLLIFQITSNNDNLTKLNVVVNDLKTDFDGQLYYTYDDATNSLTSENEAVFHGDDSIAKYFVAKIGDTYYKTLAEAVAAAKDGDTVTLLKNVVLNSTLTLNKNMTLDLNGCEISNGSTMGTNYLVSIAANANVSIVGDKANSKISDSRSNAQGTITAVVVYGKLTVEGDNLTISRGANGIAVKVEDNPGTLTVNGGTITVDKPTQTSSQAIQNWGNATISGGVFNGDVDSYAYIAANKNYVGNMTIENGTFDGEVFAAQYTNDGVTWPTKSAKVSIVGGNFKGNIAEYYHNGNNGPQPVEKVNKPDNAAESEVTVSDGYFTVDPSAYCVTGKTGVTSDKDGYQYKVGTIEVKDENEIKTDTQKGTTQATLSGEIAADKRPAAQAVGKSVTPTALTDTTPITADDKAQALTELVKNKKVKLTDDGKIPAGTTVTVVKETYLDVTVTAYDATSNTVSMDIVPKYNLIAVAKTGTDEKTVTLKSAQDAKVGSTEVKVTLPDAFKGKKVYINHNNGANLYVATANATTGEITFTTNGFSPFTFALSNPNVVAEVNGNAYTSFQDAVNAVANGGTIEIVGGNKNYTATISGSSKTFTVKNTLDSDITVKVNNDSKTVGKNNGTQSFTYTKPSSGGSSGGSSSGKTTYKVTTSAVNNGGVNASPSSAEKGATITITLSPDKGYKLDKLTVTDGSGKTVSTVKKSDTVYTFTMPASAVKVGVSYVKATDTPSETKFNDVSANDWFASAVDYVTGKGMMNGTADNTFSPKANTTRGMVVTVLYRLENQPSTSAASFTDVASGAYYANAVAWANANGIVSGYGSGKFGPNDKVTREQLAAILYRYAQYKKYDVSVGEDTNILSYDDAQSISSYAIPAIQWACGAGVVTGKSGSKLDSKGNATRAEVAAMLMRFCENVK